MIRGLYQSPFLKVAVMPEAYVNMEGKVYYNDATSEKHKKAIEKSGGTSNLLTIPSDLDEFDKINFDEIVKNNDYLHLTGNQADIADIDMASKDVLMRLMFEWKLATSFIAAGKPVSSICGGLQSLLTLFGAKLSHDLHTDLKDSGVLHCQSDINEIIKCNEKNAFNIGAEKIPFFASNPTHSVSFPQGSAAYSALRTAFPYHKLGNNGSFVEFETNGVHHQGMLEKDFKALEFIGVLKGRGVPVFSGGTNDGVLEYMQLGTLVHGFQFHPEITIKNNNIDASDVTDRMREYSKVGMALLKSVAMNSGAVGLREQGKKILSGIDVEKQIEFIRNKIESAPDVTANMNSKLEPGKAREASMSPGGRSNASSVTNDVLPPVLETQTPAKPPSGRYTGGVNGQQVFSGQSLAVGARGE